MKSRQLKGAAPLPPARGFAPTPNCRRCPRSPWFVPLSRSDIFLHEVLPMELPLRSTLGSFRSYPSRIQHIRRRSAERRTFLLNKLSLPRLPLITVLRGRFTPMRLLKFPGFDIGDAAFHVEPRSGMQGVPWLQHFALVDVCRADGWAHVAS